MATGLSSPCTLVRAVLFGHCAHMNHTVREVLEASAKYHAATDKPSQAAAVSAFEQALRKWFLEEVRTQSGAISRAASEGNRNSSLRGAN